MKTIFYSIIIIFIVSSCKPYSDNDTVNKEIYEYMMKSVDDPSTYEFVETILSDSVMVDTIQVVARQIALAGRTSVDSLAFSLECELVIDSLKQAGFTSTKMLVESYTYIHKYRIKKGKEKKLKSMHFIFNDTKDRIISPNPKYDL
ncbi:MAG TPA: hypothetical protein PKZ75_12885 [Bacteroidia bacterium]|nr:hypothetical protein [Bacteroidia bacterium]